MGQSTPYEQLGGAAGVHRLVDRFYDLMDRDPAAASIRAMHARDLRASREKLFLFLSGWLGGPGLYAERYGHPRLRRRHMPFAIGVAERDAWMHCMRRALGETVADAGLAARLGAAFADMADHMRNRDGHAADPRRRCRPGPG